MKGLLRMASANISHTSQLCVNGRTNCCVVKEQHGKMRVVFLALPQTSSVMSDK